MTVRTAKKGLDVHRQEEKAAAVIFIRRLQPVPHYNLLSLKVLTHTAGWRVSSHTLRRPRQPAGGVERAISCHPEGEQGSLVWPLFVVLSVGIYHYHRSVQRRRGAIRNWRCLRQCRLLVLVGVPLPNFRRRDGVPVHQDASHSHTESAFKLSVPGVRPSHLLPDQC
jgi:hypothetical protein